MDMKFSVNHLLNLKLKHPIEHLDGNGNITKDMDIVYMTVAISLRVSAEAPIIFLVDLLVLILVQQVLHNFLMMTADTVTLNDMASSHLNLQGSW